MTPAVAVAEVPAAPEAARASLKKFRTFARNKGALIGIFILLVFAVAAIFAPLLTPYDPTAQDLSSAFLSPSWAHPFGTDELGQDILARIMYGGRYTLAIGAVAVSIAAVVGVPLGLISGYFGGATDMVIQRVTDILLSFNPFLLALVLVAVFGVGIETVTIAAGVGVIPQFIRLARGQALSLREEVYV